MKETYKRFESYDKEFKGSRSELIFLPSVMNKILSNLKGNVLAVGVAGGHRLDIILKKAKTKKIKKVTAIEPSPLYKSAKKRLKPYRYVKVINAALEDFKSDEKFDVIIMLDVLEHLEDQKGSLSDIKNRLNPGGLFICSTPNRRIYNFIYSVTGRGIDKTHISVLTSSEFKSIIKGFFKDVEIIGVPPFAMGIYRLLPRHIRGVIDLTRLLPFPMNNYAFARK